MGRSVPLETDRDERRRAVERAYADHAGHVYRIAYAILRDPDTAADATQETFARAFERWHQYDQGRPLLGWLHGIAANAALDALRRQRVRRLALPALERSAALRDPSSLGAEDPASRMALRDLMESGLARLRPQARAALVLRHYYGYDYASIGELLGLRSGTVGSLLNRSHVELRAFLEQASERTSLTVAPSTDDEPSCSSDGRVVRKLLP